MNPIEAYIRQAAAARGYDSDAVMRVVMGEGGVEDGALRSRGFDPALGGQEQSYGPFQLNMHAGLGKRLLQEKGIDARDPANVYKGIDYALDRAGVEGWTPWVNTQNRLGYSKWTGLRHGAPAGGASPLPPGALDFVKNNPQPGGFGAGVPDPNMPSPPAQGGGFVPPAAAPAGPEQSPLGKMMAGFASGFGGMGGGGPADAGAPRVIQDGGFGATMAAQQGAEQAKQLAFTMSPDIEKLLALAPKPFARKGAALVG